MDASHTLFELGRGTLGPIFSLYVVRLAERARALGAERLFFLAREGALFRRLHAMLPGPGSRLPDAYLYVSRLATSLPAVHTFGIRELRHGFVSGAASTIGALFVRFGMDDEQMYAHARRAGFDEPDAPVTSWWEDPRLVRLIADARFQADVRHRAARARALLRRYLTEAGLFSVRRAVLADIGWAGTIQDGLTRAFVDDAAFPSVWGLYFGLGAGAARGYDGALIERKEGIVSDFRHERDLASNPVLSCPVLYELAARAPHGSTLGYEEVGGAVVPVTNERGESRRAELATQPAIDELQRGVLEFAETFPRWLAAHGGSTEAALPHARRVLERLVYLPTGAELAAIAQLTHSEDWGRGGARELLGDRTTLRDPARWLQGFHATYWKGGYLRRTGGGALCHAYRGYARLRKLGS